MSAYVANGYWAYGYAVGDVLISRPSGDIVNTDWVSTEATLSDAVNEVSFNDSNFITSPDTTLPTPGPAIMSLSTPLPAGSWAIQLRANMFGTANGMRVSLLDSSNTVLSTSSWQVLSNSYSTYTITLTIASTATRIKLEVH